MKENVIYKKTKNKFLYYSLLSKLIFFLTITKVCSPTCGPNFPFIKNGVCVQNCTLEELNNGCIIENEILKTQWINNITYLTESGNPYINLVVSENNDLIILMSAYPATNTRLFYGLNKEGRGYFTIDNKESANNSMVISKSYTVMRYEAEIFMVKLKSSSETKEYIMDFGKNPQLLHFYDPEILSLELKDISEVFYPFYILKQLMGAKVKLTSSSDNYYVIGILWADYSNSNYYFYFTLIKFSITSLTGDIIMDSKSKKTYR